MYINRLTRVSQETVVAVAQLPFGPRRFPGLNLLLLLVVLS